MDKLEHSMMRDSSGNGRVYYHGTKYDFEVFS